MASPIIQAPGIILPNVSAYEEIVGTETETINDLVTHTSYEFPTRFLQELEVHIAATEVVLAGALGNLWLWIELSPIPSANSDYWPSPLLTSAYGWAAIGGGGGVLTPTSPIIVVATGAAIPIHTCLIPWSIHSPWARLVVQMPVSATPTTAYWTVQAVVSGKTA